MDSIAAVSLRRIRAQDEAFLLSVYASTRAAELAYVPWTQKEKESFLRMQFTAQHDYYQMQFPNALFQIIMRDGRPIGRLYVDHRLDEIRLIDIALLPEFQGAGIGTSLMREVLAQASAECKCVRIHVERFNPALKLYLRLGFKVVEDQGVYCLMEHSQTEARPRA